MPDHSAIAPTVAAAVPAAAKEVMPSQESLQNGMKQLPLKYASIQPKLTVGAPDDPYEKEADAVAERVMRMPAKDFIQRKGVNTEAKNEAQPGGAMENNTSSVSAKQTGNKSFIRLKCSACKEEDQLHRKPADNDIAIIQAESQEAAPVSDAVSSSIERSRGAGSKLNTNTLSYMESRFGRDLSSVNIHTGSDAVQMNRELNAQAFTVGNDIYFNHGKFQPGSNEGDHLLAHELTHTIQQSPGIREKPKEVFSSVYQHTSPVSLVGENKVQRSKSFAPADRSDQSLGRLVHGTLLPMLKDNNTDLFVEVKIPGGNKAGNVLGSFGVADLYKAEPTQGKSRTIGLNFDGESPSFLTKDTKLDFGGGAYNHNKDAAPQGTTVTPKVKKMDAAPNMIEVGDLKPGGSGEVILGGGQLSNYMKGIDSTAEATNKYLQKNSGETDGSNRWNVFVRKMLSLNIPAKLSYPGSGIARNRLAVYDATGTVVPDSGLVGSLYVYKDQQSGIWSYEWIPDNVGTVSSGSGRVNEVLNRLRTDVIPPLVSTGTTGIQPKRNSNPQPVVVSPVKPKLQRKDEKFSDEDWKKTKFNPWKTDAEKLLGDKSEVQKLQVAEALVDVKHRNAMVPVPAEVMEKGQALSTIRHWNRFGGILGWLREKFDFIYRKVAGFAKKIKEKVQKLVQKVGSSSFGSWVKAAAKVIFKIFKMVGSWAISKILDKLLASLKEGIFNNIKILIEEVTPDDVKAKIQQFEDLKEQYQAIIEENEDKLIQRFFGDKLEFFEKLEEFEKLADTVSDIVTLVEWGIRLLACASPPAIGCLWNLAISALEFIFARLMQTCWFTKEVYAPVISKFEIVSSFPTKVAAKIADVANEYIPVPTGFEKIFAPIVINNSEFKVDCNEGGDGDAALTPERREIFELVKKEGPEKIKSLLKLTVKRGAGPWVLLTLERINQLKDALKNVEAKQLEDAANDDKKEIPAPLQEFLKNVSAYSEPEKKLIKGAADAKKAEQAAKAAKDKAVADKKTGTQSGSKGGEGNAIVAIQVPQPPDGTPVDEYPLSSPGIIGIPYGHVVPELNASKPNYFIGEKLEIEVAHWIDRKWVWLTGISATFVSMSSLNGNRILDYSTTSDIYFKATKDSTTVYMIKKGRKGLFLDVDGLP